MNPFNIRAFMSIIELIMTEKGLPFERRKERALAKIKQDHEHTLFINHIRWEDVPKSIDVDDPNPVHRKLAFLWALFATVEKAGE